MALQIGDKVIHNDYPYVIIGKNPVIIGAKSKDEYILFNWTSKRQAKTYDAQSMRTNNGQSISNI